MDRKKDFDLIMIGQITIDDVVFPEGPIRLDNMGGNVIYGLAGMYIWKQDRIGIITRMGTDFDLEELRQLTADEVDLTGVRRMDTPNLRTIEVFDRYNNRYFLHQKWAGNDKDLAPEGLDDYPEKYRGNARGICVASMPFPWCRTLLEQLPKTDEVLLVDPHFRPLFGKDRDSWRALMPKIDIWAPSEDELIDFFDIEAKKEDVRDYLPWMRAVTDMGAKICLLKLGERGAMAYDRITDRTWHIPAYPSHVVDVTGCGDTFCGGFLSGYLRNMDIFEALAYGTVSASFCIDHYDSRGNFLIKEEDARARLRDFLAVTPESGCLL